MSGYGGKHSEIIAVVAIVANCRGSRINYYYRRYTSEEITSPQSTLDGTGGSGGDGVGGGSNGGGG